MAGVRADTPSKPRPRRGFVVFKWTIYALLALDVALYARYGRLTELIDTAAWLVLLLLFEWETGGWRLPARWVPALHGVRLLASAAVVVAVAGYALERVWLDFFNEMTWLGVVALLELEVRLPPNAMRLHRLRRMAAAALYLALVGFLLTWAVMGFGDDDPRAAWLDTWDALLWLVAFVVIELNVFGADTDRRARRARAIEPSR
ncbi:hypothetical protein JI752_011825 [Lysobacter sp. MMG2]|uniref:hypothetical protein n=1 Tax=Lysobacter sp. MMG2 TaxID=2801338 RepID=UPI001C21C04D|nr:hypothetical protein [Lysobacter sp. MMG2]MBU8976832.1 hypothetical protein [Lysobacter sp. MMG2]